MHPVTSSHGKYLNFKHKEGLSYRELYIINPLLLLLLLLLFQYTVLVFNTGDIEQYFKFNYYYFFFSVCVFIA